MTHLQIKSPRLVASEMPFEHKQKETIFKTFFAISDYYKENPNPGACHLISSIFHVLLKEQDIENELCIGEVQTGFQYFDHSWIEIDGNVFDIAIQNTLDGSKNAPIYAGYDLSTEKEPSNIYGAQSPTGFDLEAKMIMQTSFVNYMNRYPHFREGAWKIVQIIGKKIRLKLDINQLKQKYKDTQRILKK